MKITMPGIVLFLALMVGACYAFAAGSISNTLSWDYDPAIVSAGTVTGFTIERMIGACSTTGTFAEIAAPAGTLRTYDDAAISQGVMYCYRAFAVGPGGKSPPSNMVAKTVPFAIPGAPGALIVK
jgi:hypothetical protein